MSILTEKIELLREAEDRAQDPRRALEKFAVQRLQTQRTIIHTVLRKKGYPQNLDFVFPEQLRWALYPAGRIRLLELKKASLLINVESGPVGPSNKGKVFEIPLSYLFLPTRTMAKETRRLILGGKIAYCRSDLMDQEKELKRLKSREEQLEKDKQRALTESEKLRAKLEKLEQLK